MTEYKPWKLTDLERVPKNGLKVMSTFSCGGGSSMGYKLNGFDVIAANDIDPQMAEHYRENLHPQQLFECPIGDLVGRAREKNLPEELYALDILDGSPPCSSFSMAGNRERDWNKNKKFREGQAEQVLSDLFFEYLDLVAELRPRVCVAENVRGMLAGNAKGYTRAIVARFRKIGYKVQVFLVNAADCGVPQKRHRVFFIAQRNDQNFPPLVLNPQSVHISCNEALVGLAPATREQLAAATPKDPRSKLLQWWGRTLPGDNFAKTREAAGTGSSFFNHTRIDPTKPCCTIPAKAVTWHWSDPRCLTVGERLRLQSFPDDYWTKTPARGAYLVGMSVPPYMMRAVSAAIYEQWLARK